MAKTSYKLIDMNDDYCDCHNGPHDGIHPVHYDKNEDEKVNEIVKFIKAQEKNVINKVIKILLSDYAVDKLKYSC